ncbi:MAG: hypothetical protein OEY99_07045 [Aigarchaeota archaeon]|nr:hypothetical protein [Aigarchaeota archaeon]
MSEKAEISVLLDRKLLDDFCQAVREEGWFNINDAIASAMRIYLYDVGFYKTGPEKRAETAYVSPLKHRV